MHTAVGVECVVLVFVFVCACLDVYVCALAWSMRPNGLIGYSNDASGELQVTVCDTRWWMFESGLFVQAP